MNMTIIVSGEIQILLNIQGLQAHTVIFDSQITGTRNAIFQV